MPRDLRSILRDGETVSRRSLFLGNRHDIRQRAAQAALFMMLQRIHASP